MEKRKSACFEVVQSEIIGAKLKQVRVKKGLKINGLTKLIGVSQGTLSDLENGKCYPSHETMSRYRFFLPKNNWNCIFFKE